jgi:hypothetical protein
MALNKAIQYGKEKRKQYIGKNYCKLVDGTCRNHGSCPWCYDTRTKKNREKDKIAKQEILNYIKYR